jgi:DNA-binding NarL/FixJ family response regulator
MADNPKRRRKVLILEDEPFIAMMLEEELDAMGIHVIGPVNNLKSAIHLAETPDLDGALLDLNINGAYATEVAGYEPPAGLRYREVPVLRKPFTPIELRTALLSLWDK